MALEMVESDICDCRDASAFMTVCLGTASNERTFLRCRFCDEHVISRGGSVIFGDESNCSAVLETLLGSCINEAADGEIPLSIVS